MKRKWKYVSKYKQEQTLELYSDIVTGCLMVCGVGGFFLLLFSIILESSS